MLKSLEAELKTWEKDFKAIHGRRPEFKDASEVVLAKYRTLSSLKQRPTSTNSDDEEPIVLPKPTRNSLPILPKVSPQMDESILSRTKPQPLRNKLSSFTTLKPSPLALHHAEDFSAPLLSSPPPVVLQQSLATDVRPILPPASASDTCVPNFLSECTQKKAQANFVKLNLKKDWTAVSKKRRLSSSSSTPQHLRSSREFNLTSSFSSSKDEDVIDTVLDLLAKDSGNETAPLQGVIQCGHNLPCQVFTVKKKSNRGRQFYSCSLGRQGSCHFFQWKDDTKESAKQVFQEVDICDVDPIEQTFASLSVSELRARLKKWRIPAVGLLKKSDLLLALQTGYRNLVSLAQEVSNSMDPLTCLQQVFFHDEFRPGQERAISRLVKEKLNTLVVAATGSGKSLLYQLPTFLFQKLTVVVSPLVSLMLDQIEQFPPGLRGSALVGTQAEQAKVLKHVLNGKVQVLFVSPERLFTQAFQSLARKLTCGMVCIDEAHCISTWSHNFRPCYLRLGEELPKLFPHAVLLALTATATLSVQAEICRLLRIDESQVTRTSWTRENLSLRMACLESEFQRTERLALLLQAKGESTIVYVSTKYETTVLAERLQNQYAIQNCAAYHAGLSLVERKSIQERFLADKLRVIIATVAFGMGLNKANVRNVIHFGMPRSVEEYTQEIGRAGRDGIDSQCVCFFDEKEAKRLIALTKSDGLEPLQLQLFVAMLPPCGGNDAFSPLFCKEATLALDCKEGTIESLLVHCHQQGVLELGSNGFGRCQLVRTRKSPLPASLDCLNYLRSSSSDDALDLISLRNDMIKINPNMTMTQVIRQLYLAKDEGYFSSVTLTDPCWFIRRCDSMSQSDLDSLLYRYLTELEFKSEEKVRHMYQACQRGVQNATLLVNYVSRYLEEDDDCISRRIQLDDEDDGVIKFSPLDTVAQRVILGDCKSLLGDSQFVLQAKKELRTARAICRIMFAVSSPLFPFEAWSNHRLWGRYKDYNFEEVKSFLIQSKVCG